MPARRPTASSDDRLRVHRLGTGSPLAEQLEQDLRTGLDATPRQLPPKYFYDERGSRLFERITRLPEYYLTRAETSILEREAGSLMEAVRPDELLELGSGYSRKTRLLLEAMHRVCDGRRYVPLDVAEDALIRAGAALTSDLPWLEVEAVVADFHDDLAEIPRGGRRLVAFLGSTIGNLGRDRRHAMLTRLAGLLGEGDRLLLGADLVKDPEVLLAAYDDSEGVTAAFNRNVLRVVARELGADIPVEAFRHEARWNREEERVEMWLVATRDVELACPSLPLTARLEAGEGIRTELSCKFHREGLETELADAGLRVERFLTDPDKRFSLSLAAVDA